MLRLAVVLILIANPAFAARVRPGHGKPDRSACLLVASFVASVGVAEAERMARASGQSEARIAAGRRCLK